MPDREVWTATIAGRCECGRTVVAHQSTGDGDEAMSWAAYLDAAPGEEGLTLGCPCHRLVSVRAVALVRSGWRAFYVGG